MAFAIGWLLQWPNDFLRTWTLPTFPSCHPRYTGINPQIWLTAYRKYTKWRNLLNTTIGKKSEKSRSDRGNLNLTGYLMILKTLCVFRSDKSIIGTFFFKKSISFKDTRWNTYSRNDMISEVYLKCLKIIQWEWGVRMGEWQTLNNNNWEAEWYAHGDHLYNSLCFLGFLT